MTGRRARVVVTGLGAVSAFGLGPEPLRENALRDGSAVGLAPKSARGIQVPARAALVGEHANAIEKLVDPRFLRRLSGLSRLAVGAAASCLEKAMPPGPDDGALRDETAVVLGTSFGSSSYHFEYYEKLFRNGIKDASPLLFSESVMNSASGHISILFKLRGASLALVGGEEVGLTAIADAVDRIQLGEARAALAGGAEEYCDFVHAGLAARGFLDADAGGEATFLSDGAALLLLEDGASAEARGAVALAQVAGCGMARSLDGSRGAAAAVEEAVSGALADAGAAPGSVDLAVLSTSGGPIGLAEAAAAARATGARGDARGQGAVCFPKRALGEGFAFVSAAQGIVAVGAIAREPAGPGRVLAVSTSRRGNVVAVLFCRADEPPAAR